MKKENEVIIQLPEFPTQSLSQHRTFYWIMQSIQAKPNMPALQIPLGFFLILVITFLLSRFLPKS